VYGIINLDINKTFQK